MSEWIDLEHEETGGRTRIPAGSPPEVLQQQEALGWRVVEDEDAGPELSFPPGRDVEPAADWVDLVHPDLPGAVNRVPNHPGALQAAADAGWVYPDPDPDAVRDELREIRPKGGRATAEQRAEAEQRAAAAGAATDEPPVVDTSPDSPDHPAAGDGTDPKE